MGVASICKVCGSDWCDGRCCVVSPKVLRTIANNIPNSGYVGDLKRLADYFERNPKELKHALKACQDGG